MTGAITRGQLAAAISNAMVGIHSKHYGKGPTKAKTYLVDDVVVTVMSDVFTTVERTLIDNDKAVAWLRKGAQPTDRVQKLLVISGAWDSFKGGT